MPWLIEKSEVKDCRRIVNVMEEQGYILTMKEAWELWSAYSMDMDAGWIQLDKTDESLFKTLIHASENLKGFKMHFDYLS